VFDTPTAHAGYLKKNVLIFYDHPWGSDTLSQDRAGHLSVPATIQITLV